MDFENLKNREMYSNKKVLLVDDAEINFPVLISILEKIGFKNENILTAKNGIDALDVLETEQVDLIITDFVMPRMGGMELIKTVKLNKRLFHTPIILNSGTPNSNIIIQAIVSGASGFFPKPYDLEIIQIEIEKALPS